MASRNTYWQRRAEQARIEVEIKKAHQAWRAEHPAEAAEQDRLQAERTARIEAARASAVCDTQGEW